MEAAFVTIIKTKRQQSSSHPVKAANQGGKGPFAHCLFCFCLFVGLFVCWGVWFVCLFVCSISDIMMCLVFVFVFVLFCFVFVFGFLLLFCFNFICCVFYTSICHPQKEIMGWLPWPWRLMQLKNSKYHPFLWIIIGFVKSWRSCFSQKRHLPELWQTSTRAVWQTLLENLKD